MAYDAEHIITTLYNNNKAEYIEIFGDVKPSRIIRNRKFTNGIQVTIDENTPGADGKPAIKLLIRDDDGNMYNLNVLADSTNYRLFTSNFRLDKENIPFTYENLKKHKAMEQAETLINNIKDFIPMSEVPDIEFKLIQGAPITAALNLFVCPIIQEDINPP